MVRRIMPARRSAGSLAAEAYFRSRLTELGAELLEPAWLGSQKRHRVRCKAGHLCHPIPDSIKIGRGPCRRCAGNDPAVAEANFRAALEALGATLLEPYRSRKYPHHVRCAAGHDCHPRPNSLFAGQGICRKCANRDPATAEAAFRDRLAELGAELLEPEWLGALVPHRVRCAAGHERRPRPADVNMGHGVCRICSGDDKDAAEAAFRAALTAAGSVLLEQYQTNKFPHLVRCTEGHETRLRPDAVTRGRGVCRVCAFKVWDVFYVVTHEGEPRVKFGITSGSGKARLRLHRSYGYRNVLRLVTGLPGTVALDTENAIRAALVLADQKPVQGREYFDISCLGLILDVADSWLGSHTATGPTEKGNDMTSVNDDVIVDPDEEIEDDVVRAKWTLDGATTLAEAAQKAREFADYLQRLHDEGYVLRQSIADDYGFYFKP